MKDSIQNYAMKQGLLIKQFHVDDGRFADNDFLTTSRTSDRPLHTAVWIPTIRM